MYELPYPLGTADNLGVAGVKPLFKVRETAPARPLPAPVAPLSLSLGYGGGPKACAQCGTTRTPQWREGPLGPKTLCNACGVKLVRKNRSQQEAKRRSGPSAKATSNSKASSPEPPTLSYDSIADSLPLISTREGTPQKRPQRKAAAKAASRTAEFATTGDWPEDEEAAYAQGPRYRHASSSSQTSSAMSQENSDSAEEVAWAPSRPLLPSSPPPHVGMPLETSAAVNLLTMSFKDSEAHGAALAPPETTAHTASDQAAYNVGNYFRLQNEMTVTERVVQDFIKNNDPAKYQEFLNVTALVETAWRSSAAADAAVAAVAKFLAQKQAAAIRQHALAKGATAKLHEFLQDLDDEYGVSRLYKKRRSC